MQFGNIGELAVAIKKMEATVNKDFTNILEKNGEVEPEP